MTNYEPKVGDKVLVEGTFKHVEETHGCKFAVLWDEFERPFAVPLWTLASRSVVTEPQPRCGCGELPTGPHYILFATAEEAQKAAKVLATAEPSLVEKISQHWLMEMRCNHEAKTDTAFCACGWRSQESQSVGKAAERWAKHLLAIVKGETK